MARTIWFAFAATMLIIPTNGWSQQSDQKGDSKNNQQQGEVARSQPAPAAAPQQDSLAAVARKVREQKKQAPKAAKVFTNDDIATSGGISSASGTTTPAAGNTPDSTATKATDSGNDEKSWRDKFSKLHHKLDQDQQELDVMQRELGVLDIQYYDDPVKAMQQQLTRSDINDQTAKIDAKKKEIEADQQAISDAEDDLRKAGGDPGWSR